VEDRIREGKTAGLRNFPRHGWKENNAWLEAVLAAADLVCWAKLICFAAMPSLARREIAAFRYRVLHVAAQLTRSARRTCLRIDPAWRWGAQIAEGSAACAPPSPDQPLPSSHHHRPAPACPPAATMPAPGASSPLSPPPGRRPLRPTATRQHEIKIKSGGLRAVQKPRERGRLEPAQRGGHPTGYLLAATQPADLPIRGAAASLGGIRSLATTWVS
jgi:hypothetical protein